MGRPLEHMTAEAFLAWEATQTERHEYFQGDIFAMAGSNERHNQVALNLYAAMRPHLRGGPCRAHLSDIKVDVAEADAYFYPDLVVICEDRPAGTASIVTAPLLIVEVLSPSTGGYDKTRKFEQYRLLGSLREYVLVDPGSRLVEVYTRVDDTAEWHLKDVRAVGTVRLTSIDLTIMPPEALTVGLTATLAAVYG